VADNGSTDCFAEIAIAEFDRDNTFVIVTSDHGESWGEHGMMFHGHSLYRDQTDVPLIVRMPSSRATASRRAEVGGVHQIPATVMDMLGLPPHIFPGKSLLDSTADGAENESDVITQVGRRSLVPGTWPTSRTSLSALVTERWHYIQLDIGRAELYDNIVDPREEHDLSADPAQRETVARLRAELRLRNKGKRVQ
jgi:arylsulfatase A-like enzyme